MSKIEELYKSYEKPIFRYLYGMTGNYHVAEELTQETFFQVVKSFHRFKGDSHITTWLFKVAKFTHNNWSRKKFTKDLPLIEIPLQSEESDPLDKILESERIRLMGETLRDLPEKQREVLILRDWEELSYEEIGIITGRSLAWVKVNINRARGNFKQTFVQKEGLNHGQEK
ncbi:RNA polymerase sigma factor [Evansella tamaricis]|uniref:Sigma-70 family RNA polymerase sigma factor n=1 Tax=Evansella tamaricis TaxID=2069301 RepID=A0ABS6JCY1_9BACI|nr:sigma-70 family RNA polymerase sigma factor [Evansella tamaricis]MBU9711524.1 sigma-70 family RNA polymerase sigma factor [Evansella tamaricis]